MQPALRSALEAQHSPPSFTDEAIAKMNAAEDEFNSGLDDVFRRLAEWMGGTVSDVDDYPWGDALWLYRRYWEFNKARTEADLASATAELTRRVETLNTLPPQAPAARDIQRRLIAESDARYLPPTAEVILGGGSAQPTGPAGPAHRVRQTGPPRSADLPHPRFGGGTPVTGQR